MGLNLSNQQIAQELGLNGDDDMASHLRGGLVAKVPEATLEGTVEADEVYVVAGHKGNPVQKKVGPGGAGGLEPVLKGHHWARTPPLATRYLQ